MEIEFLFPSISVKPVFRFWIFRVRPYADPHAHVRLYLTSVTIKLGAPSIMAIAKHAVPRLAFCFDATLHSEDFLAV